LNKLISIIVAGAFAVSSTAVLAQAKKDEPAKAPATTTAPAPKADAGDKKAAREAKRAERKAERAKKKADREAKRAERKAKKAGKAAAADKGATPAPASK
jgi:uncharacterized membrane protein